MTEPRRCVCGHRLPALEADVLELLPAVAAPMTVAEVQGALAVEGPAAVVMGFLRAARAKRAAAGGRSR